MNSDAAERVAIEALTWLAGQEELLTQFLGQTGASAQDLRTQAKNPEFLGFVLEFVLQDDAAVVGFCDAAGHAYDLPMRARVHLPGGDLPHWT